MYTMLPQVSKIIILERLRKNNNTAYRSSVLSTQKLQQLDEDTVFLEDEGYFLSKRNAQMSSSALAAGAEANTREHIFDGMKKRKLMPRLGQEQN